MPALWRRESDDTKKAAVLLFFLDSRGYERERQITLLGLPAARCENKKTREGNLVTARAILLAFRLTPSFPSPGLYNGWEKSDKEEGEEKEEHDI
jgi:hypothetical protein